MNRPPIDVDPPTTALVGAARRGDRDAFRRLVERSWPRLVRLARSVVGDADAEDAVQEGLLAAWRALPGLASAERFDSWVARIVFRRCLRRMRRRPRLVALDDGHDVGYTPDPASEVALTEILQRLAPRQRAVLHLTVVEGMSDSEIGACLGIAAGSVRAHRRRARQRVRAMLDGGRR